MLATFLSTLRDPIYKGLSTTPMLLRLLVDLYNQNPRWKAENRHTLYEAAEQYLLKLPDKKFDKPDKFDEEIRDKLKPIVNDKQATMKYLQRFAWEQHQGRSKEFAY